MNHAEIQLRMADYLEGDLPISERALFDAHLDACEVCAHDVAELRAAVSLLRSLPDLEPPRDLAASVMRRIETGEGQPSWWDRAIHALGRATELRILLPAATVAAALAFVLAQPPSSHPVPLVERVRALAASRSPEAPRTEVVADRESPAQAPEVERRVPPDVIRIEKLLQGMAQPDPSQPSFFISQRGAPRRLIGTDTVPLDIPPSEPAAPTGVDVVGFVRPVGAGSALGAGDDPADGQERANRALDRRLEILLSDPALFTRDLQTYTATEQELWLKKLAGRAAALGVGDRVVQTLRHSGDPDAFALAGRVARVLDSARPETVASEAK